MTKGINFSFLVSLVILLSTGPIFCQNRILLKINGFGGYGGQYTKPVQFPESFSCIYFHPEKQKRNLGIKYSLSIQYILKPRLSLGAFAYSSKYSFTETGTVYGLGGGSPYTIKRDFNLKGVGVLSGYTIIKSKVDKLSGYLGITHDYLTNDDSWNNNLEHRKKFSGIIMLEYSHNLLDNLYITAGGYFSSAFVRYFDIVDYVPYEYGGTIGVEYTFWKKDK